MARNVEFKATLADLNAAVMLAERLTGSCALDIFQDDTFFACPNGRLKLRAFSETRAELIFYRRPDVAGPKESFYLISRTASPETLREALTLAYGQVGRVVKHRRLFLLDRTRIHIDRVEGLGDFLEVEVVLADDETIDDGLVVAQELLDKLGVASNELIDKAYVDLLNAGSGATSPTA